MKLVGANTLLAFADDIVILGASQNALENSAKRLSKASHNMGLSVNESKKKYMVMSRHEILKNNFKVNGYSFKYMEVNINEKNYMYSKIKLRMSATNRNYYVMKEMLSKLLSRQTIERLYTTYLRLIVT